MEAYIGDPAAVTDVPGPVHRGRPRDPTVDAAILTAAVDLLAEAGFARLTMEQVAARAGVGKASLYLRWPNKTALVAEAIQYRSAVVPDVPDTGSLARDMRSFLQALLRGKPAAQRALAAVTGEIASNPDLRRAWHRSVAGMLVARLRLIVARAVERGELPSASDVELLALLPLTLLQNWRLHYEQSPDTAVVERIIAQFYTPASQAGVGQEEGEGRREIWRGTRDVAPLLPAPPPGPEHDRSAGQVAGPTTGGGHDPGT